MKLLKNIFIICFFAYMGSLVGCSSHQDRGAKGGGSNEFVVFSNTLSPGFDVGVNSSGGKTDWLNKEGKAMKMSYPSGEEWGAVFIVSGIVSDPPQTSEDFSSFGFLSVDLKGANGNEGLKIGIRDINTAINEEVTIPVSGLTTDWTTKTFNLSNSAGFNSENTDLSKLYIVIEFIFEGSSSQTVYFKNVKYLPLPLGGGACVTLPIFEKGLEKEFEIGNSNSNESVEWSINADNEDNEANNLEIFYPAANEETGLFITLGNSFEASRPSMDFSEYKTLEFDLKGKTGGESIKINIQDRDNESNKKIEIYNLTTTWQTFKLPLTSFPQINLKKIIKVIELTYDEQEAQTVYIKNIKYTDEQQDHSPITCNNEHLIFSKNNGLSEGFGMGINTSEDETSWLYDLGDDGMKMTYPSNQEWGALFITVGEPTNQDKPSRDFSEYKTLSIDIRGETGSELVEVGIKDKDDPDDGTEDKIEICPTTNWQTLTIPLENFTTADLENLYVLTEFVFSGEESQTVYFGDIKFLKDEHNLSLGSPCSTPDILSIFLKTGLAKGFGLGIDTSGNRTDWLDILYDEGLQMSYPSGQDGGALFITVGDPTDSPRTSMDLSEYKTLMFDIRSDVGDELVEVGIKDKDDPDDGTETKIKVCPTIEWQTISIPLNDFNSADLQNLYVVSEFVFSGLKAQTVYLKNVKYLKEEVPPTDLSICNNPPASPSVLTIVDSESSLSEEFGLGIDTSQKRTNWLDILYGEGLKMSYPSGQNWGALFITVGDPTNSLRPSMDLSEYKTLTFDIRGEVGDESVEVGIKDKDDPDDGTETKIKVCSTIEWQTIAISLNDFNSADLQNLYVVSEFVFSGLKAQTVYLKNVKYLKKEVPPTDLSMCHSPSPPSVLTIIDSESTLSEGFGLGIDTSGNRTDWLDILHDEGLQMSYPSVQEWGALFITVGDPTDLSKQSMDLSEYKILIFDIRGEVGDELVEVGIKDKDDPDDGTETKIKICPAIEWQTIAISLNDFNSADLQNLYVVSEFVFSGLKAQTVYIKNVKYLKEEVPPTDLSMCHSPSLPSVLTIVDSESSLSEGFGLGIDTSGNRTDWLDVLYDEGLQMSYPSGQDWGALFITVGDPTDPPRPLMDLSEYKTLTFDIRGDMGDEFVEVGIKDKDDPDDGTETKIKVCTTTEWQTISIPLNNFSSADLQNLYVVSEFVFSGLKAQTVYLKNVKYLKEEVPPTDLSMCNSPPLPSVLTIVDSESSLSEGFGLGIDTSGNRTDWLDVLYSEGLQMSYPSGQDWGALFITFGDPTDPPRPSMDFSEYKTLIFDIRGDVENELVEVGIKDKDDPDDGTETKIKVCPTIEWQTIKVPIDLFRSADLSHLYVILEFVFSGQTAQTVYLKNVKYSQELLAPNYSDSCGGTRGEFKEFHVTTSVQLQNALLEIEDISGESIIYLSSGTYNGGFIYETYHNNSLTIQPEENIGDGEVIFDGGELDRTLTINGENAFVDIEVKNIIIKNGNASSSGGGLFIQTLGSVNIENCIFENNASTDKGGGVFIDSIDNVTMVNNKFFENSADGTGGAIYVFTEKNIVFKDNIIQNGSSLKNAGGAYVESFNKILFNNNKITNNSATNIGGVYLDSTSEIEFINNKIIDNTANSYGIDDNRYGGSYLKSEEITFVNNVISSNTVYCQSSSSGNCNANGAGTYISIDSKLNLINNTIAQNSSSCERGAYYHCSFGSCPGWRKGTCSTNGGGIYFNILKENTSINITNNIIWGNTASIGSDIYIQGEGADVQLFNNDYGIISGSYAFTLDHIDSDPLFLNVDNFHLTLDSPTINKGTNEEANLPNTDIDGNYRIIDSIVDLGAYEYTGTLPQDIIITDSVEPMDDLKILFGNRLISEEVPLEHIVSLTNNNAVDIEISDIIQENPLDLPFDISEDNCSNITIISTESCTITISFSPETFDKFYDSFTIPFNTADNRKVTITVEGTGVELGE